MPKRVEFEEPFMGAFLDFIQWIVAPIALFVAWCPLVFSGSIFFGSVLIIGGFVFAIHAGLSLQGKISGSEGRDIVEKIAKDGCRSHIRHPWYVGNFIQSVGIWIVLRSVIPGEPIILIPILTLCAVLFRAWMEEMCLSALPEYADYQKHTKRFIPFIY